MPRVRENRTGPVAAVLLISVLGVAGATNVWQGGDGNWTDAKWTVNGTPNQTLATPPTIYTNANFIISLTDSTLTSAGRPALEGGSWTQDSGIVALTGGGNNSGASFGHNGTATTVLLSGDAALDLTGSGGAGTALSARVGTMTLSNNAAIVCNNKNFEIQNGFTVTLRDNSRITAPYVNFSSGGAANARLTLASGTITLTGNNPVQTPAFGTAPGNRINFTGPAGAGQVVNTDNSAPASNLAAKLAAGFFCIDGTVVTDEATFVGGRRFSLSTAGSTDTLQLTTNPVGGSLTLSVLPSFPGTSLAQNPPPGSRGTNAVVSSGNLKGQTVSFTNGVTISNLVFRIDDATVSADLAGSVQLEIYQTLNNLPVGGAVFSDAGALPGGLAAGNCLQITLPTPLVLSRGRYAVMLGSSDASVNFKASTGDAYAGGVLLRKDSSTANQWALATPSGRDLVFALGGSLQGETAVPTNRPNIVVVLADDLGWTDISSGNPNLNHPSDFYQTPNIAKLAQQGLSFTSCYMSPNCSPSRAAILSGQYACRSGNGVYNVQDLNRGTGTPSLVGPAQNEDVPATTYTMAEMLRNAGYVTAHLGKYHVGGHEGGNSTMPLNQGFDWNFGGTSAGNPGNYEASSTGVFNANVGPALDWYGLPYTLSYINTNLLPFANGFDPLTINGNNKQLEDAEADAAVAFLWDHLSGPLANRPFYLQWHSYAVHTPLKSRADIKAKYNALPPGTNHTGTTYAGLVEGLDQAIGRLVAFLDDPNGDGNKSDSVASNTIVVFGSDNGGEQSSTVNTPLRAYKGTLFEGGIRDPLIIRWPGHVPTNTVTDTMVQNVDLYPTLMELAGGSTTQILDGVSFAAHMLNPAVPRPRGPIYYHFPGYLDDRARPSSMVIKEINGKRYKLIYSYDYTYDPTPSDNAIKVLTQPWELYNLTDDLSETKNLIDGTYTGWLLEGAIADELAANLVGWLTQATPGWSAKQPTYRSNGATVPHPPSNVPDVPPPGGQEFRVTRTTFDQGAHQVSLTWNSETGFRYSIWASSDLRAWTQLAGNLIPTGSSTTRTVSDPSLGFAPRYYRVEVQRP